MFKLAVFHYSSMSQAVKISTSPSQMENIQMFLTFCENYGLPKSGQFQTVDLFEGTNMPQFLACIQQLGTEVMAPLSPESYR